MEEPKYRASGKVILHSHAGAWERGNLKPVTCNPQPEEYHITMYTTFRNQLRYFTLFLITFLIPWACSAEERGDTVRLRERMVNEQIVDRGVTNPRVIRAMKRVPRHLFVPENQRAHAYGDYPLPIGEGQTISQPYIVAFMTEALQLRPEDKVLEIGTGSGYQAAVLSELVREVYSIEIVADLGIKAQETLAKLGYSNIHVKIGDGYKGWPEKAPFGAIIVTCAPEKIPKSLVRQLKEGGRMIIPVGKAGAIQKLVRAIKKEGSLVAHEVMLVRFVPMVRNRR
jgi:protein-L-isoaspartate(D-aspartate) O-methyltransferase